MSRELEEVEHMAASGELDRDILATFTEGRSEPETREQFWLAVQKCVQERLGRERYSLWFRQTELMSVEDDRMVVGVPNVVIQQWLTERYTDPVQEAVSELLGRPTAVTFDVAPRLFRQMKAEREEVELEEKERRQEPRAFSQPQPSTGPPPQWSFDSLIATPSNRLAFAAAREVVGQQTPQFSSLYVYGGYGVGKTALLRAAYSLACGPQSGLKPCLKSTEDWCNEYYHAIQQKTTRAFRHRYRSCDLLILDDLQFIQGKASGQGELLHTVKHVVGNGGRVILAGKPHPDEMTEIDPALSALLKRMFLTAIKPPTGGQWQEVVEELARRRGLDATERVYRYVADNFGDGFGRVESAVSCLSLFSGINGCGRLELATAREALSHLQPTRVDERPVSLNAIKSAVLSVFDVPTEKLMGNCRTRSVCQARHVAMYLARQMTGTSLAEIGRFFGGSSHSTVKHAVDKIDDLLDNDRQLSASVDEIKSRLKAG